MTASRRSGGRVWSKNLFIVGEGSAEGECGLDDVEEAVHVEQGASHGVRSRPLEKAACFIMDCYRFLCTKVCAIHSSCVMLAGSAGMLSQL